ncbi:MAG: GNAT family N-acetyltransferase [Candidatus Binatia bacterium]
MPTAFERRVLSVFADYKQSRRNPRILEVLDEHGTSLAHMTSVRPTPEHARRIAEWRTRESRHFLTWLAVSENDALTWIRQAVLSRPDRILFMIQTPEGVPVGHIGLTNFDFRLETCEIDYAVRGRRDLLPGIMSLAYHRITLWALDDLGARAIFGKTFESNVRSIEILKRCGYALVKRFPLQRTEEPGRVTWVECRPAPPRGAETRYGVEYARYRSPVEETSTTP